MHQDTANRVRSEATRLIPSTVYTLGDADRFRLLALIAKLGCVVQYKNETSAAAARSRVDWKWPARMSASLTRSLEKKR
jgi:hypothetical protein